MEGGGRRREGKEGRRNGTGRRREREEERTGKRKKGMCVNREEKEGNVCEQGRERRECG